MGARGNKQLDVSDFYASPRHAWWFLSQEDEQEKIYRRVQDMLTNHGIVDRKPNQGVIINLQENPPIVEMHDGNASAVAWLLYRRIRGLSTDWEDFSSSCRPPPKAVLLDRRHPATNEVWHPYVPSEVASVDHERAPADRLQDAPPDEKGKTSKKALTCGNRPIYFNNTEYFGGDNKSQTIGHIAENIQEMPEFKRRFSLSM
eukprot:scaffold3199_cov165-Amphora_coffeaeformis.AAC.9